MSVVVAAPDLARFVAAIFVASGVSAEESAGIAHHLLSANLTGHDSHGVIRVPRYVVNLRDGHVRAGQTITVAAETAAHALIDGNMGFGQTIGPLAVDYGIAKARAAGLAVIGLRNTGHIGRIGDWAERAADAGLVSVHFVNVAGSQLVAPYGAKAKRFGTNPVAIGVPQAAGHLILDFATSIVAEGKVLVASNGGAALPADALVGPDGHFNADPRTLYGDTLHTPVRNAANGNGAIRAFGDHKGSGLAFMCELLAGCLTGNGTGGPIPPGPFRGISNGMLSLYIAPGAFGTAGFADAVRDYADYIHAVEPIDPAAPVILPGEKEARIRAERLARGVPLQSGTWAALSETAATLSVSIPPHALHGEQSSVS